MKILKFLGIQPIYNSKHCIVGSHVKGTIMAESKRFQNCKNAIISQKIHDLSTENTRSA